MKSKSFVSIFAAVILGLSLILTPATDVKAASSFYNAIREGADPSVIYLNGYYYLVNSDGNRSVFVTKSATLTGLGSGNTVKIWDTAWGGNCCEVWAPEIMFVNGGLYVYYTASQGSNNTHRMYAIQANDSNNPQGAYTYKGKVSDATDKWAIDGAVLVKSSSEYYFVWSGWEGDVDGRQDLYIAPMSNPWTISGPRAKISQPASWETASNGIGVNEGPQPIIKNGVISIVYSANGSWTDDYCLARIRYNGGTITSMSSWVKSSGCVFSKSTSRGVYGPGHNSFVKSPNGTQDWLVYHAQSVSGRGWDDRSIRAQTFSWNADNTPNFGTPYATTTALAVPAGESTGAAQGWGNSGSGTAASGLWSYSTAAGATLSSLGTSGWEHTFTGSTSPTSYTVQAELQWMATGTAAYPKYGIYATYKDSNNFVTAFLDKNSGVLATYAMVNGVGQAWQNTALSIDFDAFNTLKVVKSGSNYSFYVNNSLKQTRTFNISNGQIGLLSENVRANFRNVTIS